MLLDAKFPLRYVFQRIRPDVVRVLLISIFFHLLKLALGEYLPLIPLQLPTILGSSISLLLAFKTSQSYDRWWEARKIWGAIANDSRTLVRLCEAMGQAERIKFTVFPVSYRLLVYFFIYLFLMTLSLGLVKTIGLWEIPVLLTTASLFFLLERTARDLQAPISNKPTDTPVTAIARTVEINLRQLLHEPAVPAPLAPEAFFLM